MGFHSDEINYDNMAYAMLSEEEKAAETARLKVQNAAELEKYDAREARRAQARKLIAPIIAGLKEAGVKRDSVFWKDLLDASAPGGCMQLVREFFHAEMVAVAYCTSWMGSIEIGITESEIIVALGRKRVLRAPRAPR